jgi:CHAD domain-containing protein
MADATTIESEAKFDVDTDFEPPDLRPLVGRTERLPELHLRTTYYDTTDRRLWRQGLTLRYRAGESGNGDPHIDRGVWTLKLPQGSGGEMLERTEVTVAGDKDAVPDQISAILQGIVRRSAATEITELDTTRRRLVLFAAGADQPWAELDDDLVTVIGGPNDGLQFRQVELELRGDQSASAGSVLEALRKSGARSTREPKLALALSLPELEQAPGPKSRQQETVAATVQASIRAGLDRLLDHDYRLRAEPARPDAEHVHQARVATRRLRSDLQTFGPLLDPVWLRHTTEELRWIGGILGRVRDADVLANGLWAGSGQESSSGKGDLDLMKRLGAERRRAAADLAAALGDDRYLNLLDRLHAAAHSPPVIRGAASAETDSRWDPDDQASEVLPALVHDRWRSLRRRVRKAGRHPTDRQLHRIRIAAKRLRYAAESAAAVVGPPASRSALAAERLQTTLGAFHDAVQAEAWLRSKVEEPRVNAAAGFAAGMLARDQQIKQQVLRRTWRRDWKRVRRKKNRFWLNG